MFRSRVVVGRLLAAGVSIFLLAQSAVASLIWSGDPSQGMSVFKLLNLEDSNGNSESNPSPNGSSITTTTDPLYGAEWQFCKAANDERAEAHGAAGFNPAIGSTYYLGWRFKVNSTVTDNAVFQWKAYGSPLQQNYPLVLKFVNGSLQLHYFAPGTIDHLLWSQSESPNQWNTVVLEIKVSELNVTSGAGAGAISFWWDGTEENLGGEGSTYIGSTFDGTSVDPKWGVYGAVGTQVTNDITALKIGTTYNDVAPSPNFLPGDFNRDGQVTAADIPAMMQALTNLKTYQATYSLTNAQLMEIGDLDGTGQVTNADLQALIDLLANGGGNGSLTVVPEPASIVLLGIGVMAIAFYRRSRCEVEAFGWKWKSNGYDPNENLVVGARGSRNHGPRQSCS